MFLRGAPGPCAARFCAWAGSRSGTSRSERESISTTWPGWSTRAPSFRRRTVRSRPVTRARPHLPEPRTRRSPLPDDGRGAGTRRALVRVLGQPVYDRFSGLSSTSFREVSEREGTPSSSSSSSGRRSARRRRTRRSMRDDELVSFRCSPCNSPWWVPTPRSSSGRCASTATPSVRIAGPRPLVARRISFAAFRLRITQARCRRRSSSARGARALIEQAILANLPGEPGAHRGAENLIEEVEDALDRGGSAAG